MTEISVSLPEDWHIDETSDGRIRLSIFQNVSLWHPYDASLMAVTLAHLANKMTLDRLDHLDPEETHATT
jgi:hypothetical protein